MYYAIAVVVILIADQAVKFYTTKNILLNAVGPDCVKLIDGVVHMTNVHNYGAAFGIFQNARWPLTILSAVFVIAIIVLISHEVIHTPAGRWLAVLVVAGALGNCIDRLLYGYVVDMFEVEFLSFAVFNVADIFITVCGILFCIHLLLHNEPEAVREANEPEFIRRRREAKAAAKKNDPYAAIPKRGEHRSLAEELAPEDPDDLFSEWSFGDEVPAPRPEPEPEPESKPEPAPEPEPEPTPEPEPAPAEEPALPEVPESEPDGEEETYSLDDILAEFGDF